MAQKTVFTGTLGIIKVKGKIVGRCRQIRAEESFTQDETRGIGNATPQEFNFTMWGGTVTLGHHLVEFTKSPVFNSMRRFGHDALINHLLHDPDGITIDVFRKRPGATDSDSMLISSNLRHEFSIQGVFITSDGFSLPENQKGTRDQSFRYKYPITTIL